MDNDFKNLIDKCFQNYICGDRSAFILLYFEIEKKLVEERQKGYEEGFETASTIAMEVVDNHNKTLKK